MGDKLKISCNWKRVGFSMLCILIGVCLFVGADKGMIGKKLEFLASGIGLLLLCLGPCLFVFNVARSYKIDRQGIRTYYFKLIDIYTPWEECIYVGIEREFLLRYIVCIRRNGTYALRIPYNEKILENIRHYAPEEIPQNVSVEKRRFIDKQKDSLVLRDTEGELIIDDRKKYAEEHKALPVGIALFACWFAVMDMILLFMGAENVPIWFWPIPLMVIGCFVLENYEEYMAYGRKMIINREGINIVDNRKHQQIFYPWQEFDEIGAFWFLGGRHESASFWIVCSSRGKILKRKIKVRYTPARYKQFLTYVPEGALTHPPTHKFEMEWLKKHK